MTSHLKQIPAGEFKAKCLHILDQVRDQHIPVVITKRGKPVAKIVPFEEKQVNVFGYMKGSVTINADIVEPIDISWSADNE